MPTNNPEVVPRHLTGEVQFHEIPETFSLDADYHAELKDLWLRSSETATEWSGVVIKKANRLGIFPLGNQEADGVEIPVFDLFRASHLEGRELNERFIRKECESFNQAVRDILIAGAHYRGTILYLLPSTVREENPQFEDLVRSFGELMNREQFAGMAHTHSNYTEFSYLPSIRDYWVFLANSNLCAPFSVVVAEHSIAMLIRTQGTRSDFSYIEDCIPGGIFANALELDCLKAIYPPGQAYCRLLDKNCGLYQTALYHGNIRDGEYHLKFPER